MSGTFLYSNPRIVHWGAGSVSRLADELTRVGALRPGVVTTRSLLGSLDRLPVTPAATVAVAQHSPMSQVDAGVEEAHRTEVDAVVSFGGGSAVDAAKIISLRLADRRGAPVPHFAVPTTLSVAELASGAGYTNEAGDKAGLRDARMLPEAVIYDGELTLPTPLELWLSTGIRALDHAVEGFLAEGEHPFNDVMALEAIRRLFDSLPRCKASPGDVSIRTENQLGAWFSYTLPAASAGGLGHVMGKQIGARHGIPHGVTSCLLMPHVMRYQAVLQPARYAALAAATGDDPAQRVHDLIASLELPQHIARYGIGEAELRRAAAELAGKHPARDLEEIYFSAL